MPVGAGAPLRSGPDLGKAFPHGFAARQQNEDRGRRTDIAAQNADTASENATTNKRRADAYVENVKNLSRYRDAVVRDHEATRLLRAELGYAQINERAVTAYTRAVIDNRKVALREQEAAGKFTEGEKQQLQSYRDRINRMETRINSSIRRKDWKSVRQDTDHLNGLQGEFKTLVGSRKMPSLPAADRPGDGSGVTLEGLTEAIRRADPHLSPEEAKRRAQQHLRGH